MTEDYEVRGSELAYDGHLSRIRIDEVAMPDGEVVDREIVEHPSAVAVVAIDDDDQVILLRQYRHPVAGHVLEIPAGKLDVAGEERSDAAARELQEETGLSAGSLTELVTFHNSAGWTDEQTTVYLAEGVTEGEQPEDFTPAAEEAAMEIVRMPFSDAVAAARRGEIPDAKTLIGLLLADQRRRGA